MGGKMRPLTELVRKKRLKLILPELDKRDRIIDLGGGDGWLTTALREEGYECIELDWVVNPLPFKDNEFDCSILIEVIEHLIPEMIPEIERITKKKVIISTIIPNTSHILKILSSMKLIMPLGTPHKNEYWIENIPFRNFELNHSEKYWLIDQFGVFVRK